MEVAEPNEGFIPKHGGYRNLISFKKAEIIYDGTVYFTKRFNLESPESVIKIITINSSVSKVWHALTNSALLETWMLDGQGSVNSDWKLGSTVLIKARINGKYESKGTVLISEPPKLLKYNSWTRISTLADKEENYSLVEFRLLEEGDQTHLTITNSNLIAEAAYEHANFYWQVALQELKKLVES